MRDNQNHRYVLACFILILIINVNFQLVSQTPGSEPPLPSFYTLVPPPAMPEDKELLRRLTDSPQDLLSKVTLIRRESADICITQQDMHVVYPMELRKIRGVIVDYARYPEYFSRIKKSEFVVKGPITRQDQVTSVTVLGFEIKSVFSIELIETAGAHPGSVIIRWYQTAGDHSIEAIQGYWYLEEFTRDGKPATYVRYSTATEVPKTMFGQDVFMGLFLSSFARENLTQMHNAAVNF